MADDVEGEVPFAGPIGCAGLEPAGQFEPAQGGQDFDIEQMRRRDVVLEQVEQGDFDASGRPDASTIAEASTTINGGRP